MEEFLKCPITLMIFNDPVSANDGHIYEKEALEEFMTTSKTKTIFSKEIKCFHRNYTMRNIIDKILEKNPKLKEEQYVTKIPVLTTIIDLFLKKDYDTLKKMILSYELFCKMGDELLIELVKIPEAVSILTSIPFKTTDEEEKGYLNHISTMIINNLSADSNDILKNISHFNFYYNDIINVMLRLKHTHIIKDIRHYIITYFQKNRWIDYLIEKYNSKKITNTELLFLIKDLEL